MSLLFLLLICVCGVLCCDLNNLNSCLFSGSYEFLDLSHAFEHDTVYWPNSRRFEWVNMMAGFRADGSWYAANDFCAGEHGGTHLDAPYHFDKDGAKVGQIALDKLILPLYVIDVSSQVNDDPDFVLHKSHVNHMLNLFDTNTPALVVFKFGWTKFYSQPRKYLGLSENNATLRFPGISGEMAEFIVGHRNVVGVGVDTASVDPGSSQDFPAHKKLLGAGLYALENVKMDVTLPDIKCTALVMPMKIKAGTGAPLRLTAICPKQTASSFSARDFY